MDVSPEYASYLRVSVNNGEEFICIIEFHGIYPGAADRNWLVMKADQGMPVGVCC